MATVTYIPEKTQSKTAMGKVMRYCARQDKTAYELDGRQIQLISGKDCVGETAYREFMATKQQYGKANGMFFYQYVQSFSPDEKITPQQAHEIGYQFAEYFKGHEVLIATHTDAAHIHTHFIINSVNHENGKKLQMARGSIHDLRKFSDKICQQQGLSIVQPKQKSGLRSREYRAATKGESWKFKLISAIDSAMLHSQTKADFIKEMQKMGYQVKWRDELKYITYTTPEGMKCRDNKLHEEKYLKGNMEDFYVEREFESIEQTRKSDRRISGQSTVLRNPAGSIEQLSDNPNGNRQVSSAHAGANRGTADMGKLGGTDTAGSKQSNEQSGSSRGGLRKHPAAGLSTQHEQSENGSKQNPHGQVKSIREQLASARQHNDQTEVEVDRDRSSHTDLIVGAAMAIANLIVEPEEDEKKKYVPKAERRHKQKKKSITPNRDKDWEMEM